MTISVVYEPDVYTGNGVLTTYPITFSFLSVSANVKVSLKSSIDNLIVEKTAATHYNVVGTNVVFEAAYIPIATDTVIIELDPDYLQSSDYVENSNFSAETLERDFDKLKLEVQLLRDTGRRAIRVDATVDLAVTDPNSTFQSDVGLEIGVDVQAYNANLTDIASDWTVATSTSAASIKLYEDTDNGTNYVELKAPAALASNVTLTLPIDDGTASQALITDGSGVLSWADQAVMPTTTLDLSEGITLGSAGHTGYVELIDTTDDTKSVTLKGFDNLTASYSLQMPANVGTPGYVLSTDGTAGNLSWVSSAAVAAGATNDIQFNTGDALDGNNSFYTDGSGNVYASNSIQSKATLSVGANTTVANDGYLYLYAKSPGGSNLGKYCRLSFGGTAGNISLVLPTALAGVSGSVLSSTDAGVLSWSVPTYNLNSAWTALTATTGASLKFGEGSNNGSNFVTIKAGDTLAGDTTYTLPTAYGTTGQALVSTDAGVMSWANNLLAAVQSDQETGTSNTVAVTPGTQHFHQSAAKAWGHSGNMNGATPTIAGYNVGAITDNGTGNYTVEITTDFSSADYAVVASGVGASSAVLEIATSNSAAGSVLIISQTGAGISTDLLELDIVCFGDQ